MESTPVCGVAIRKLVQAPCDAPSRRNPTLVGITPHEHKGRGTPMAAALMTLFMFRGARCRFSIFAGTKALSSPAKKKPKIRKGAISAVIISSASQ